MSSVLARYDVSGDRKKPKPSGSTSSTPSPKICSPCLARFFMMANMISCLRRRLALSMSRLAAISSNCDTCSAFSSVRCMREKKGIRAKWVADSRRARAQGRWLRLNGFVEEGGQLGFGQRPYLGRGGFAVFEQHQGGDAAYAEPGCGVGIFVDVEFCNGNTALVLLGGFVEQGCDHLAGAAPGGPVVDQDRAVGL